MNDGFCVRLSNSQFSILMDVQTSSSSFTWEITGFSRLNTAKYYSDEFLVGDYQCQLSIYPEGRDNGDHLSVDLEISDLPYSSSRYVQFSFAVVNQKFSRYTVRKETYESDHHGFNHIKTYHGFTSFMPLSVLCNPSKGFLVKDTVIVQAEVSLPKVVRYLAYNSKKETGCVGLKNQGTTGYMNCTLQTLYHIPCFRKAIYQMPTTLDDRPGVDIPITLQRLFFKLQYNDVAVSTKGLTRSFGWVLDDSFMQHDAHELTRVFVEKLEDKMKGTAMEGAIKQLFEGHQVNCVHCINVDYKSTRKESFYDLQLDVKGCRDVYDSFDKYVEYERLEGDNKYHVAEHGLQEAIKGALFLDFPPVLQLQLKRFEYDFMRDRMVKVNDRYEFPLELDLDRGNGKYLSPYADRRVRNRYKLHSVVVHSGGELGGRYYTFIRPTLSDQWFKFDDEWVTKEDVKIALEGQYGGKEELSLVNPGFKNFTRYWNAYILVYIRESDEEHIMCNLDEQDISENLWLRMKKEQEEKTESHIYTRIKVARDEDLVKQIGRDIYFDLVDHDKVRCFRVQKQMPFNIFKEEVAKEFGIPIHFQRFWLLVKRQNGTCRPHRPLTPLEETQPMAQFRQVSNKTSAGLKLFLEVEMGLDLCPIQPPRYTKEDDILIFFKLYDPTKEELHYVGRLFVKASGCPAEILTKLNAMAGFSSSQEIELYEEIKFEPSVMCELVDKRQTFQDSQLEDGDIVCFQKSPLTESLQQYRYRDLPSFFEYVNNLQVVRFRLLEKPMEDSFCLELSKRFNYDEVAERVTSQLGVHDPLKIRLTCHNCYSQRPKQTPIGYRGMDNLSDMLVDHDRTSDILYYEVLETPLSHKEEEVPIATASNSGTEKSTGSSCVICWNSPAEGACLPCGHMSGCMPCLTKIKGKRWGCPVCRTKIQQIVRIYTV